MLRKFVVLVGLVVVLVPATAFAGSPLVDGYGGEPAQVVKVIGGGSTTTKPAVASVGGKLPFTGVDLGLVVIAGVGLVLMGASLRRIARGSDR
jgi:hypothetical protein